MIPRYIRKSEVGTKVWFVTVINTLGTLGKADHVMGSLTILMTDPNLRMTISLTFFLLVFPTHSAKSDTLATVADSRITDTWAGNIIST